MWKKVVTSGSFAELESLYVQDDINISGSIILNSGSFSEGDLLTIDSNKRIVPLNSVPLITYTGPTASIDLSNLPGGTHIFDLDSSGSCRIETSNPKQGGVYTLHLFNGSSTEVTFGSDTWYGIDRSSTFTTQSMNHSLITCYYSSSNYYTTLDV